MNKLKHFARQVVLLLIVLISANLVLAAVENTVLIVDDNDAEPDNDEITSAAYYMDIINNNISYNNGINYSITYWNESDPAYGSPSLSDLQSHGTVIWSIGAFYDTVPSTSDQTLLEQYVAQGGKLIISGDYMLWQSRQNSFTDNVLHANCPISPCLSDLDDINITNITHPVTQGFALHEIFTTTSSPTSDIAPDKVTNVVGGAHILAVRGPASADIGLATIVAFQNSTTGARVLYLAFTLLTLNTTNRTNLVRNAMNWMDDYAPTVNTITITPSNNTDYFDPDAQINFTVNVTDLHNVSAVKFSYKCAAGAGVCSPGTDVFTNITMNYSSTSKLYENASFTPDVPGIWQYRIWSNDTLGNEDYSNTLNISVAYDYSWTRTPSLFDNSACTFSATCTAGNLTINNTGDFTLNFDISSNFADTSYNLTEPFDLAAKGVKVVEINLTAGSTASENSVVITTDATYEDTENADPDTETTNFTFTVSAGGPVFELTIASYPVEVNRSFSGAFNLSAKLKNIGNETADDTWVNWTLPDNWINITGRLNQNFSSITSQETVYHNITVNLTSSATTGTKTINVTAASNDSATDSATASIVVTETTTVTIVISAATGGGGGGSTSGGGGGGVIEAAKAEEIEISQIVDLVRGEDNKFRINVTNTFEDSVLENLTMQVNGFLSQYLTIAPKTITSLEYMQTQEFTVTVSAPAYKGYEEHVLNATITGMLIKTIKTQNYTVTSKNPFILKNYISLIIHEISKDKATISLQEAANLIEEMQQAGFPVKKAVKLLGEAEEKLDIRRYQLTKDINDQIIIIRDNAFSANSLMQDVESKIKEAEDKGLQVEETKRLLNLALAAFEREDFLTAIQKTKDAQLSIIIETKGKINVVNFIINNWFSLLIVLIILSIGSYFARKQLILLMISRRLEDMQKEEATINELIRETQEKHYKDKTISTTEYHKAMYNYEKRLDEISQLMTRLRSKRVGIIKISNEMGNLKKEDETVVKLIKQLQDNYFNKQTITKKAYSRKEEEYNLRRVEIEKSMAILEAKLAKKEKLEQLKAKESPKKEIISEIKKKESKFKKHPPAEKPKGKNGRFNFKNLFKRGKQKQEGHSKDVHGLLDELIKRKDKFKHGFLSKARIRTIQEKILGKRKEKINEISAIKSKKLIKAIIPQKISKNKKEVISTLRNMFKLDNLIPKKLKKRDVGKEYKKHFSADGDVLRKHGFRIKVHGEKKPKPAYVMPKSHSHTKHSILNYFKEVYKHG